MKNLECVITTRTVFTSKLLVIILDPLQLTSIKPNPLPPRLLVNVQICSTKAVVEHPTTAGCVVDLLKNKLHPTISEDRSGSYCFRWHSVNEFRLTMRLAFSHYPCTCQDHFYFIILFNSGWKSQPGYIFYSVSWQQWIFLTRPPLERGPWQIGQILLKRLDCWRFHTRQPAIRGI